MGANCSTSYKYTKSPYSLEFAVRGFEGAGKTCVLKRLSTGEFVPPDPSEEDQDEDIIIQYNGTEILGLEYRLRYFQSRCWFGRGSEYDLIYVIDSSDVDHMDVALYELNILVLQKEEMYNKVVMVLATKQDAANALTPAQVEDRLREKCPAQSFDITMFVMGCSALTGEGLTEAFDYFVKLSKEKSRKGGNVPIGLIPGVWDPAYRAQEAEKMAAAKKPGNKIVDKLKNAKLKNPVDLFKAILFT